VQGKAEKLISLSRTKSLHNIRRAMAILQDKAVVQKLFNEIGPYYTERPGGYTRVVRLAKRRLGDNTVQAYLGFVRDSAEGEAAE
jgi:large subunit ribosomal protein L17